ncbi:MAG: DUF3365 domain-containing protein, partial [Candidatus Marinimicrobia bacterium]|nr:DUF3365 domain-containing protein [Candidatus Neomarinimicrobiota bacterium]
MSGIIISFNRMSIRNKLIMIFSIIFVIGFVFNFIVASNKLRSESEAYIVQQAQELTAALEEVRNGMGAIFSGDMYNMTELLNNPEKLFLAVPVVQSLIVGAKLAENADYSFKAPAFNARNPDNDPTPLEARLLTTMRDENLATIWEIDR